MLRDDDSSNDAHATDIDEARAARPVPEKIRSAVQRTHLTLLCLDLSAYNLSHLRLSSAAGPACSRSGPANRVFGSFVTLIG